MIGNSSARDCPSPCSPESDPPMADDQVGSFMNKRFVLLDTRGAFQVEIDTRMNASAGTLQRHSSCRPIAGGYPAIPECWVFGAVIR